MNIKPMMFAIMLMAGAGSVVALGGCAGVPGEDEAQANANAAAAAAPADNAAPIAPVSAAPAASPAPVEAVEEPLVPDNALNARVKAALAAHSRFGLAHIKVATREGVVRLSGAVSNSVQIDQAQYLVGEVSGVREIDNRLIVRR